MSNRLRALLATATLAAAAAFGAAPASASQVCIVELSELTGWCNVCSPIGGPYNTVNHALHDKLPALVCAA